MGGAVLISSTRELVSGSSPQHWEDSVLAVLIPVTAVADT